MTIVIKSILMKLSNKEKNLYSEKFMDLGNLAIAALIFGQFVSNVSVNFLLILFALFFMHYA